MLMMLTAKNTLPAESPSGADLATLLISVFLIFMKYQRKIKKKKGFMLARVVVSIAALMTPLGGCSLKRLGEVDGCCSSSSSSSSPPFTVFVIKA